MPFNFKPSAELMGEIATYAFFGAIFAAIVGISWCTPHPALPHHNARIHSFAHRPPLT
jgi:hypothetical protein